MINSIKDNIMLMKDSARSRLLTRPGLNRMPVAEEIIKHLGIKSAKRVIVKESTILIITNTMIIRVPRNKASAERCEVNKETLESLVDTPIALNVPRFLYKGHAGNQAYYCEEKLSGYAIDIPISKMDKLVMKTADFLINFQKETAKSAIITDKKFKVLFGSEFDRLLPYLPAEYIEKLEKIELSIKKEVLDKRLKVVWSHGDYNIENTLFDTKRWQLQGVIDWDLANKESLPLLDIFYLLLYKESLLSKKPIAVTFKERFEKKNFVNSDNTIINKYLKSLAISERFIEPLLIMFWVNHVGKRYHDHLVRSSTENTAWVRENVYEIIDLILRNTRYSILNTNDSKRS